MLTGVVRVVAVDDDDAEFFRPGVAEVFDLGGVCVFSFSGFLLVEEEDEVVVNVRIEEIPSQIRKKDSFDTNAKVCVFLIYPLVQERNRNGCIDGMLIAVFVSF